jgi:hypothetical protein
VGAFAGAGAGRCAVVREEQPLTAKIAILAPVDPRPDYMSIWELAHRWHDAVPSDDSETSVTPAIRDTLGALLQSIVNAEFAVYEMVVGGEAENGATRGSRITPWPLDGVPVELEQMYLSGVYRRELLAYYRLSLETAFHWAVHKGFEVPDFCIPDWLSTGSPPATAERKPKASAQDKATCQAIAKRKWSEDPNIRIAEMARDREIQIEANGKHYTEPTLLAWLREVAPDTVKGRPGRPSKASSEDN